MASVKERFRPETEESRTTSNGTRLPTRNVYPDADNDTDHSTVKQSRKPTLYPRPSGPAAEWLKMTPLLFSDGELIKAQRFYEAILAAREEWLRVMNRRLPSEEQLDRERYAPRRREFAK